MNRASNASSQNLIKPNGLKIINALFLVAGTCTGGGMLALPIASSQLGFWPSVIVMSLSCIFMTITGLLFLEATLWMKSGTHIITMSKNLLNKFGQITCWLTYLFIGYASLIGYTSGAGKEISFVFTNILSIPLSPSVSSFLFMLFFGLILYLGYKIVERVNTILFVGMVTAYLFMIVIGQKEIHFDLLKRQEWSLSSLFIIVPLMLTTFSFPGIVPTVVPYLNQDIKSLRIAIIGGTSLTFLIYVVWLCIVFGSVPFEGPHGLQEAFLCDIPATECIHYAIKNPFLSYTAQFFAFFALTTSFLGIALALFDFLSDGLKIPKLSSGKIFLTLLITIPSLFFALNFQRAFITALELSGGIGDSIISGLIPALMIWSGRYKSKISQEKDYKVIGGKFLLIVIIFISLIILFYEIFRRVI